MWFWLTYPFSSIDGDIPVYMCVGGCGVIVYFSYYKLVHDNRGMYLFSHWPPLSVCNFFFSNPP